MKSRSRISAHKISYRIFHIHLFSITIRYKD